MRRSSPRGKMLHTLPGSAVRTLSGASLLGSAALLGLGLACTRESVASEEAGASAEASSTEIETEGGANSADSGEVDESGSTPDLSETPATPDESESSATGDTSSEVDCEVSISPPDIQLEPNDVVDARALGVVPELIGASEHGEVVFVCGQGGILRVAGGEVRRLDLGLLDGKITCKGLRVLDGDRAVVLASSGALLTVQHELDGELVIASQLELHPDGRSFAEIAHDFEVVGQTVWVAMGELGIAVVEIEATTLREVARWQGQGVTGARAIAALGPGGLVSADDQGEVFLLDWSGRSLQSHQSLGGAVRAVGDGERYVAVLRGGLGLEVFELVDDAMVFRGDAVPPGSAFDARFVSDTVLVAAGSELVRLAIDAESDEPFPALKSISLHPRPGRGEIAGEWFRSLSATGPLLAATQSRVMALELGAGLPAPALWFDRATISMFTRPDDDGDHHDPDDPDDVALGLIIAANRGQAPLILTDVAVDAPFSSELSADLLNPRAGCPGQFIVPPGVKFYVSVEFSPKSSEPVRARLALTTNDPHGPQGSETTWLEGNLPPVELGSVGIDVPMLTQRGRLFTLSEFRGRYLLLKLFNSE